MNLILPLILLFSTVALAGGDGGGGWSSGGGDPLRFYFEEGKVLAANLVQKFEAPADGANPDAVAFLLTHRDELADDIRASPQAWTIEGTQPTCGHTSFTRDAEITLSLPNCRSVSTSAEAAKLLIHESVHHFGVTAEDLADAVALTAAAAWEAAKLRTVPACATIDPIAGRLPGIWRVDVPLTRKLGGKLATGPRATVTFTKDPGALARFQGFGHCAWLAGTMSIEGPRGARSSPYVVVEWKGEPHLITLDDDGTPAPVIPAPIPGLRKGLRPWALSLTRALRPDSDLLFLGRFVSGEAVSAYGRAE